MYFLPLLSALVTYLAFPSILLAVAMAIFTYGYIAVGGETFSMNKIRNAYGQNRYRILSVKLLALNGELTEKTYEVHALLTPDEAETGELRNDLRNAACLDGADWKHWARLVHKSWRLNPDVILEAYDKLIVQLRASPNGITDETQDRLIEIGKMWGIGPANARKFLANMNVAPSPRMAAW